MLAAFLEARRVARRAVKLAFSTGADELPPNLEGVLARGIRELRPRFRGKSRSWFERAAIRSFFLEQVGDELWFVRGLRELGDFYPEYRVTLNRETGKYSCSCFNSAFGGVRKARICTHIAAVMLRRRVESSLPGFFG